MKAAIFFRDGSTQKALTLYIAYARKVRASGLALVASW
ncbi:hypothetical protein SAMN05421759_1031 [Roseivivax lentus]|uniref:Uncharacterized protein n=1 Tax=Roseivivax lentus TaxID=633194 RepID=A0A1N7LNH3_9RHOB|nr:hypothetical protein SAMN05421759_1031 [Roseivivax lentus]